MNSFTIDNWMVAWTPSHGAPRLRKGGPSEQPGSVRVGPWPDRVRWSDAYDFTVGCCDFDRSDLDLEGKVGQMFIDFHTLIVRDGIDPQAAHLEFLKIDEYRRRISPEITGADLGNES